jgi:hypothetical protein
MILNAIDPIPDFLATLTNVTADMSAATILSRSERAPAPALRTAPGTASRSSGAG